MIGARREERSPLLVLSKGAREVIVEALRETVSVQELAALASSDPAFAARVLSLANSALYSVARNVTNVSVAASLLGVRGLRSAALGMLVADMVPQAEGAVELLHNCLRRALAARGLAAASGLVAPDDAFFAGLLLELGLLHQACDDFERAVVCARSPARFRMVRERALGLSPHPIRGAALARELALPDAMIEAIAAHHAPEAPKEPLAAVCWAAEMVAGVLERGDEVRSLRFAEAACAQVGVRSLDVAELCARVDAGTRELAEAVQPGSEPEGGRGALRSAAEEAGALLLEYEESMRLVEELLDERDALRARLEDLVGARESA